MTKQHRATSRQWNIVYNAADSGSSIDACILELRNRVEALEATQHVHAETSRLSEEERQQLIGELNKPGFWRPDRTEMADIEATARFHRAMELMRMQPLRVEQTTSTPPQTDPHNGRPALKPCPFCGSTNLRFHFAGSQGYIECNECNTEGPCDEEAADPHCDIDAAYHAWNRRHV